MITIEKLRGLAQSGTFRSDDRETLDEIWKFVENSEPYHYAHSLHIYEHRYKVAGVIITLYFVIGDDEYPCDAKVEME